MLLVVVDQPGIGRRGEDPVERPCQRHVARVSVQHGRLTPRVTHTGELRDPREGVECVTAEKADRRVDGTALATVLVAPVLLALRRLRRLEIEVGRLPGRPRSPREDHAKDVAMPVLRDQSSECDEFGGRRGRVPLAQVIAHTPAAPRQRLDTHRHIPQLRRHFEEIVGSRLDPHEQAIESGDVHARRVQTALEGLDEHRPRPCERIKDVVARLEVAVEQHLDELRDELAVVWVEPVDVLRPLALRELGLRPREVEVQGRVQLVLRDGHANRFDATTRTPAGSAVRGLRARRSHRTRRRAPRAPAGRRATLLPPVAADAASRP